MKTTFYMPREHHWVLMSIGVVLASFLTLYAALWLWMTLRWESLALTVLVSMVMMILLPLVWTLYVGLRVQHDNYNITRPFLSCVGVIIDRLRNTRLHELSLLEKVDNWRLNYMRAVEKWESEIDIEERYESLERQRRLRKKYLDYWIIRFGRALVKELQRRLSKPWIRFLALLSILSLYQEIFDLAKLVSDALSWILSS